MGGTSLRSRHGMTQGFSVRRDPVCDKSFGDCLRLHIGSPQYDTQGTWAN